MYMHSARLVWGMGTLAKTEAFENRWPMAHGALVKQHAAAMGFCPLCCLHNGRGRAFDFLLHHHFQ
jgi:hypothetical protein